MSGSNKNLQNLWKDILCHVLKISSMSNDEISSVTDLVRNSCTPLGQLRKKFGKERSLWSTMLSSLLSGETPYGSFGGVIQRPAWIQIVRLPPWPGSPSSLLENFDTDFRESANLLLRNLDGKRPLFSSLSHSKQGGLDLYQK